MSNISAFYTDVQRIIKHDRADNCGLYNGLRASKAVANFFEKKTDELAGLPQAITDYWLKKYIKSAPDIQQEPTDKNIDWLVQVLALLYGEFEKDMQFSKADWKELANMTNFEAEELSIDVLSDLMSEFISHKVI